MGFRHSCNGYFGVWFFLLGQVGVGKDYLDLGQYLLGYNTIFGFDRTDTTILSLRMTPNLSPEPSPIAVVCPLSWLASARRGSVHGR